MGGDPFGDDADTKALGFVFAAFRSNTRSIDRSRGKPPVFDAASHHPGQTIFAAGIASRKDAMQDTLQM
jgi:hypothetical protein